MRKLGILQRCAVAMACVGILVPHAAFATTPAANAVVDVALLNGGVLQGKVVDQQGIEQAGTAVRIGQRGQLLAATQTDANGHFAVSGLRGGVYQIETAAGVNVYRLWAAQTAPPSATDAVLVVSGDELARGQYGSGAGGGIMSGLGNPWVLGGIVAAAIAIPLALDDDDAS